MQGSVLAHTKPDSYGYPPSAPVVYDILDGKIIEEGAIWYILENMQRVTRSKTPGPIVVRFEQSGHASPTCSSHVGLESHCRGPLHRRA